MAFTMRDYLDKKVSELVEEQGYTEDSAEDVARNEWNEELTDEQRLRFLETGNIEEVDDSHPIIKKMIDKEEKIEQHKQSKDYYPDSKIKIIEESLFLAKGVQNLQRRDYVLVSLPINGHILNKISKEIMVFEFLNILGGRNEYSGLIQEFKDIEENFKMWKKKHKVES